MDIKQINPLVTLGLISYKQEKFIEEAVVSALAQDYEPLEIVICDDCSPDNTFSIIERLVSDYSGPHKVIINRNERNLGLAGNINRMWELSSGEFLVIQAGDDISVPHRTSRLVEAWLSTDPHPSIVYSNELFIDENGVKLFENRSIRTKDPSRAIKETLTGKKNFVIGGCSAGYDRSTHFDVGPLLSDVRAEDFVYSFRSLLAHGSVGVDEALILYRQSPESIIGKHKRKMENHEVVMKGELTRFVEYKRAIDFYGYVPFSLRWRLNRKIKFLHRAILARKGGPSDKILFALWLVFTGRYGFMIDYLSHKINWRTSSGHG